MRLWMLAVLCASAAAAETPMSPEAFDAWSRGKTLDYALGGQILGSEAYGPDRKVRDADTGGPCIDGSWFARGDEVCFVYDGREGEHCWRFWRDGDRVLARPATADPAGHPQVVTVSPEPLACAGPDVGV